MTFAIRTAVAADIPAMHAVRRAVRENALTDPGRITEASYRPYVMAGAAWVAIVDRAVVGFAALDHGDASVWALFVGPEHERCGIGRALHDEMLSRARQRGLTCLWLVTATATRAEGFYLGAGWTRCAGGKSGETRFERSLGGAG